ncbi:MAG: hypothetical protein IBX50_11110 [Marinospirillum sp.]|uniref:hypothetical protein n=1 Tax=Marinospirillum sp. TaxID=2183934 RepID=UPI001A00D188|nr:hypothetical protein [Marinospirillum sp.]MBE0507252.1 hypothetical protein [Marinospirillum sp.]
MAIPSVEAPVNPGVRFVPVKWEEAGGDGDDHIAMTNNEGTAFAVRNKSHQCLNKQLEWEEEPSPSNRDQAFLERCRFSSLDDAVNALGQHRNIVKESFDRYTRKKGKEGNYQLFDQRENRWVDSSDIGNDYVVALLWMLLPFPEVTPSSSSSESSSSGSSFDSSSGSDGFSGYDLGGSSGSSFSSSDFGGCD